MSPTHLSQALKDFYVREGKVIRFRNRRSLNQVALEMWERLGHSHMDASALSRILRGERLFTTAQLEAFCDVLHLNIQDRDRLSACLQQDYNDRFHISATPGPLSAPLARELISELSRDAFDLFYQGHYGVLEHRYELIEQLMEGGEATLEPDSTTGLNLYLQGRIIANGELPNRVIPRLYPIYQRLVTLSRNLGNQLLYGYAQILLCNAFYLAGGYSEAANKQRYYLKAIMLAKKGIDNLPDDDNESLFALRSLTASACYIHDIDALDYAVRRTKRVLPQQPEENYINALLVSATIGRGAALLQDADPFAEQEESSARFQRSLTNTGVYEISAIKEEVEALLLLKTNDTGYVRERLKAGLTLAAAYKFPRQKKYFNQLLQSL